MDGHDTSIHWDGRQFCFRCTGGDVNVFVHRYSLKDDAERMARLHEIGFDVPYEMLSLQHMASLTQLTPLPLSALPLTAGA